MTPEIKHRIGLIRRGEMPEGYNRVRDSIIPSDWKQYCLVELGKSKTNAKTTKRNFFILWINQKIPAN